MLRLRQIAVVASDLTRAEDDIVSTLGLERCFRDPGVGVFGLHNALFPIGDQFLEVVSPTTEGTTAGRLLEKRGGDGGYMLLLQTDDLAGFRRRFDEFGARVVHEAIDDGIVGLHLHPRDIGGAVVSIDQTDDPAEWTWAGPDWRSFGNDSVISGLVAVEIQTSDPVATGTRWSELLDRPMIDQQINCDDGVIRFVTAEDGRGDGIGAFDVVASDRSQAGTSHSVAGVRVNMV